MEFRKREVKPPKQFRKRTVEAKKGTVTSNDNKTTSPPPSMHDIQNLNRRLVVKIRCELFELSSLNEVDILCPYPSLNKTYNQNSSIRSFEYPLPPNGSLVLKEIVDFWNEKHKEKMINKPKYSIRNVPAESEEKQETS